MNKQRKIMIDPISCCSLLLILKSKGGILGNATGFIVEKNDDYFLITNFHVISGDEDEDTKPDEIEILYHSTAKLGSWVIRSEKLYKDEVPEWIEHPKGNSIDVIALPLKDIDLEIKIYPFDLNLANVDMIPRPAMPVSIVGYPAGIMTGGGFPIWKTGHIASDPDLNYDNKPMFLIDATTRGGMSGSPVILRLGGGFQQSDGSRMMVSSGFFTKFLGIYSGRIMSEESTELGQVWRPHLILDILNSY